MFTTILSWFNLNKLAIGVLSSVAIFISGLLVGYHYAKNSDENKYKDIVIANKDKQLYNANIIINSQSKQNISSQNQIKSLTQTISDIKEQSANEINTLKQNLMRNRNRSTNSHGVASNVLCGIGKTNSNNTMPTTTTNANPNQYADALDRCLLREAGYREYANICRTVNNAKASWYEDLKNNQNTTIEELK